MASDWATSARSFWEIVVETQDWPTDAGVGNGTVSGNSAVCLCSVSTRRTDASLDSSAIALWRACPCPLQRSQPWSGFPGWPFSPSFAYFEDRQPTNSIVQMFYGFGIPIAVAWLFLLYNNRYVNRSLTHMGIIVLTLSAELLALTPIFLFFIMSQDARQKRE